MTPERNVLGDELDPCGGEPLTGFYRDGNCSCGEEDIGLHAVCAVMTEEFLEHQRSVGNDLTTPVPEYAFAGLRPGDRWCVVAARWLQAYHDGVASPGRPRLDERASPRGHLALGAPRARRRRAAGPEQPGLNPQ